MMVPGRNQQEKFALLSYLAGKLDTEPERLVGSMPFEILGAIMREQMMGVALFTNYRNASIELVWGGEPGWLTRGHLQSVFGYIFDQLACRRVVGVVEKSNRASRSLCERLGCRTVGALEHEFGLGRDGILYSLTRERCRWVSQQQPTFGMGSGRYVVDPTVAEVGHG